MNLFFYMRGEDGVIELVTAPLNDIVLPGVTRDSIIQLARQHKIRVSERRQTMQQLIAAMNAGRVLEAFGAGTACVVSPVREINFKGTAYDIPLGKEPGSKSGPMAQFFWDELTKIQVCQAVACAKRCEKSNPFLQYCRGAGLHVSASYTYPHTHLP